MMKYTKRALNDVVRSEDSGAVRKGPHFLKPRLTLIGSLRLYEQGHRIKERPSGILNLWGPQGSSGVLRGTRWAAKGLTSASGRSVRT